MITTTSSATSTTATNTTVAANPVEPVPTSSSSTSFLGRVVNKIFNKNRPEGSIQKQLGTLSSHATSTELSESFEKLTVGNSLASKNSMNEGELYSSSTSKSRGGPSSSSKFYHEYPVSEWYQAMNGIIELKKSIIPNSMFSMEYKADFLLKQAMILAGGKRREHIAFSASVESLQERATRLRNHNMSQTGAPELLLTGALSRPDCPRPCTVTTADTLQVIKQLNELFKDEELLPLREPVHRAIVNRLLEQDVLEKLTNVRQKRLQSYGVMPSEEKTQELKQSEADQERDKGQFLELFSNYFENITALDDHVPGLARICVNELRKFFRNENHLIDLLEMSEGMRVFFRF